MQVIQVLDILFDLCTANLTLCQVQALFTDPLYVYGHDLQHESACLHSCPVANFTRHPHQLPNPYC